MALTEKQRRLILDRDDHTSQLTQYSEEKGWHRSQGYCGDGENCTHLHVHHVEPSGIGMSEGKNRKDIDTASNLITVFECEHTGRCPERKLPGGAKYVEIGSEEQLVIHPDTTLAYQNYRGIRKPTSFDVMAEIRAEARANGEVYWEDSWDTILTDTADERTRCKAAEGWIFYTISD